MKLNIPLKEFTSEEFKVKKYEKEPEDPKSKFSDWCGIFTLFILRQAGVTTNTWFNLPWRWSGAARGWSQQWGGSTAAMADPKPGDLANRDPRTTNHYAIVVGVEGDQVITVDGNADPYSSIVVRKQAKASWTYFINTVGD